MIVVDTNVITYLLVTGDHTPMAEQIWKTDSVWAAPRLWRSEFRNILALYLRKNLLTLPAAQLLCQEAEELLRDREFEVASAQVLNLAELSGLTAYDCEFVAVAQNLEVPLITSDRQLLKAFPATAVSMEKFCD